MKTLHDSAGALLLAAARRAGARRGGASRRAAAKLPYVYTKWKHFTVADGLPERPHLRGKVDGPRVWVGTEDGLALIDKPTGKVVKSWTGEGRPALARSSRRSTSTRRPATSGSACSAAAWRGFSGGRFDHWHQLNSGLVNDVVYGVAVENDNVWAATTAGARRFNTVTGEWTIFTEKNAPMEEIWNYGVELRRQGQGLPGGLGQRRARVRRSRPGAGRSTSIPTARWRSTSTATTASTT